MPLSEMLAEVTAPRVRSLLFERDPRVLDSDQVTAFEDLVRGAAVQVVLLTGTNPPTGRVRNLAVEAISVQTASEIEYAAFPEQQAPGDSGRGYHLHQRYLELLAELRSTINGNGGTVPGSRSRSSTPTRRACADGSSDVLRVDVDTRAADALLDSIAGRVDNPAAVLRRLGTLIEDYERDVFETRDAGNWPTLSPDTIRIKGHARPMVDTGGLLEALTNARVDGDSVAVTAPEYAKYPARRRNPTPAPPAGVVAQWADDLLGHITGGRA